MLEERGAANGGRGGGGQVSEQGLSRLMGDGGAVLQLKQQASHTRSTNTVNEATHRASERAYCDLLRRIMARPAWKTPPMLAADDADVLCQYTVTTISYGAA